MQHDMTNRVARRCLTRKNCKMQRALEIVVVPVRAYLGNITHYTLKKLQVFRLRRPRLSVARS